GELQEEERAFRVTEQARGDAEEGRRRIDEVNMARSAEAGALRRALEEHQAERGRLAASVAELRPRRRAAEKRVAELEAEIERLDGLETPLAEEQAELERERLELGRAMADLEAQEKGLLARQEVIEARRAELAESPGEGFLRRRGGPSLGLLRDLIEAPADLWPAVRAALGPFADAVAYEDRRGAMADAQAEPAAGITLAVEEGPDAPLPSLFGERSLFRAVRPDARVRRLVGMLLGEVYVVNNVAEAEAKQRLHPSAQFVTPQGTLVGPSFVRTSPGSEARLEEVRRMSAALDRDMAGVRRGLRETRQGLAASAGRAEAVRTRLEEADRAITTAADEMSSVSADMAAMAREEQVLAERSAAVQASVDGLADRLASMPEPVVELPPLPPPAEPPVHLRVEVEALRRELARLQAGVERARRDLQELAAEDPVALRRELQQAEGHRAAAEESLAAEEEALVEA